jgi:hypothetical protein
LFKGKVRSKELDSIQFLKHAYVGFLQARYSAEGHMDRVLFLSLLLPFKYLFINSVKSTREFSSPRGLAFLTSVENSSSQQMIKFYSPLLLGVEVRR